MNLFQKILMLALVPVLLLQAAGETEARDYSDHTARHHEHQRSGHEHGILHNRRYNNNQPRYRRRVAGVPSSQQNLGQRVVQPVKTAGNTVADVGEDVVTREPGQAVEDAARGTGQTVKDVLAIPFGGRNR